MDSLKIVVIVWALLFSGASLWAKADGYKIVLASYPKFEDAKKALKALEQKLGQEDFELQEKQGFEFVARSSGRAFIIGIEPVAGKNATAQVLKRYKRWYPGAYSDKYYGLTKGSVFIEHTAPVAEAAEVPAAEETVPKMNAAAEENLTDASPVISDTAPAVAEKPKEKTEAETGHDVRNDLLSYVKVVAALGVFVAFVMIIRRSSKKSKRAASKSAVVSEKKEAPEAAVEVTSESEETQPEEPAGTPPPEPIEEKQVEIESDTALIESLSSEVTPDIFYRLSQNIFFVTLIRELKTAADNKEAQQCRDLMDEVSRYQKNFKHSAIIDQMNELTDAKAFDRLSALIEQELP